MELKWGDFPFQVLTGDSFLRAVISLHAMVFSNIYQLGFAC